MNNGFLEVSSAPEKTSEKDPALGKLQRTIRDLVALSSLPSIWLESELTLALQSVADVLRASLPVWNLFLKVQLPNGTACLMVGAHGLKKSQLDPSRVQALLDQVNPEAMDGATSFKGSGLENMRGVVQPIYAESHQIGFFLACYEDREAEESDRLLLHVGANQVALLFQLERKNEQTLARKVAEARLRQTEHLYKQCIESLPIAVYLCDEEGQVTVCNQQAIRLLGRPPELHEGAWSGSWKLLKPDGEPLAPAEWPTSIAIRERVSINGQEVVVERPDGSRSAVLAHSNPLRTETNALAGAINVLVDISSIKETEAMLQMRTSSLEIINQVGSALSAELNLERLVVAITEGGREVTRAHFGAFVYNETNDNEETYTLYTLEEGSTDSFQKIPLPKTNTIFAPSSLGKETVRIADIATDARFGGPIPHPCLPQGRLPVRSYLAVPVISRSGVILGGLFYGHPEPGVFTEESEKSIAAIASQAAIAIDNAHLYRRLEEELTVRKKSEKAKDHFLAALSHELRTPLTPVLMNAERLRKKWSEESEAGQLIDSIIRNIRIEKNLVDELLDLSRLVHDKFEIRPEDTNLHPIIQRVLQNFRPFLDKTHQVEVSLEAANDQLWADPVRLQQVIQNLLHNAEKFTPPGGYIRLKTSQEDSLFCISVRDSGVGIEDKLEKIFNPFEQERPEMTQAFGGLGLGLAISKAIVEAHGGTIHGKSQGRNQGAEFLVRLPQVENFHGNSGPRDHPARWA